MQLKLLKTTELPKIPRILWTAELKCLENPGFRASRKRTRALSKVVNRVMRADS